MRKKQKSSPGVVTLVDSPEPVCPEVSYTMKDFEEDPTTVLAELRAQGRNDLADELDEETAEGDGSAVEAREHTPVGLKSE